jgi:ubiquinone/menaquinone biosynthesis C-methylase UbiE
MNRETKSEVPHISKPYYESHYYADGKIESVLKTLDSPLHRYRIRKILQLHTPGPAEITLDLGCAWGTIAFAVSPLARRVIGLDFSQKALRICADRAREQARTNLDFICADAMNTGIKPATIDVVISADLFEHLYPHQFTAVLDECRRILRTDGRLVIWTPHRGHFIEGLKNNNIILKKDESHVDYKSKRLMVAELQKRGFRILKSYYAESHIPFLSYVEKLFLPIVPLLRRRIAILAQKT